MDERSFIRILQSLCILKNRIHERLQDKDFWLKCFETLTTKINDDKLDVYHKTNLLWIIASNHHVLTESNDFKESHDSLIESLTDELKKSFLSESLINSTGSEKQRSVRYLG